VETFCQYKLLIAAINKLQPYYSRISVLDCFKESYVYFTSTAVGRPQEGEGSVSRGRLWTGGSQKSWFPYGHHKWM